MWPNHHTIFQFPEIHFIKFHLDILHSSWPVNGTEENHYILHLNYHIRIFICFAPLSCIHFPLPFDFIHRNKSGWTVIFGQFPFAVTISTEKPSVDPFLYTITLPRHYAIKTSAEKPSVDPFLYPATLQQRYDIAVSTDNPSVDHC
jgi:hypothetical protein